MSAARLAIRPEMGGKGAAGAFLVGCRPAEKASLRKNCTSEQGNCQAAGWLRAWEAARGDVDISVTCENIWAQESLLGDFPADFRAILGAKRDFAGTRGPSWFELK
jgi:hypothetical protein